MTYCIMPRGIGTQFCWVTSHCGLYWNEIADKLAKRGTMKNMSEIYNNLQFWYHEIASILEKSRTTKKSICDTFLFKVFSKSNIQVTSKFMEN